MALIRRFYFNHPEMMKKLTLFLFLLIACIRLQAQYAYDSAKLIADLKYLSSDVMAGRETGTPGNAKAMDFIIQRLKNNDVTPYIKEYKQVFALNNQVNGINILGEIPGKKKETIVLSAHYDHVGTRNNIVYNGTDDNASGVSALLAMIKYFKNNPPAHRIIFAFFDAEEKGLKGSEYFVNTLNPKKDNIVLNVNLDMVSRSDKNTIYACGGYHYPHVKAIIEKVNTPASITLGFGYDDPILKRNDWTSQSDHYNFHRKKIPFVYFGVEDHEDYHRPSDDFEKVNQDFYKKSVETIVQCIIALDKQLQ
jgi:Zn-dependent M28 family amino/carboxypeptidase